VVMATNDRFLRKNQSAAAENGIFIVQASGAPVRATDADSGAELLGASCFVSEGTVNANTQWTCTTPATITPGSTALTFVQINASGGSVATDTIWDAAGDTVYGTGANVSARLAKGTALQIYRMNAGATAPEWATLPASGATDSTAAAILALTTGDEGEIHHANSSSGDVAEDGFFAWNENAGELQQFVTVTPAEAIAISDGYQGLLTVSAMMALTGVEGMTCSLSGVGNRVPYARYDATAGVWRPLGGRQLIFRLAADAGQTTGPGNTTPVLLAGCQCAVPSDVIGADGMGLSYKATGEKLDGSAGESPSMTLLWGPLGTTSDPILAGPFPFTTATSRQIPVDGAFVRRSATTVQLIGTGSISKEQRWTTLPNSAVPVPIASGNLGTTDNYLSFIATGTGSGTQYVVIHSFDVYWEG
ncbi:MAG: hypothetical protein KA760_15410, partial [Steroidobacteraceae bacterium]|nr:hypothetical protein [Steroidobacteraceae bacterium]